MILQGQEKFEKIGLTSEDSQFLESQRFGISEVARIYNIPLHLLAEMEKSTSWGSGLQEMNQLFIDHVMAKWVLKWENEINRKLLVEDNIYGKFIMDGLLRGNNLDRINSYEKASRIGLYSINELREKEELDNIGKDGDVRIIPVNMSTLSKISKEQKENE
jgi:HK97 family phage portal protein